MEKRIVFLHRETTIIVGGAGVARPARLRRDAMHAGFDLGRITVKEDAAHALALAGQDAAFFIEKHAAGESDPGGAPKAMSISPSDSRCWLRSPGAGTTRANRART